MKVIEQLRDIRVDYIVDKHHMLLHFWAMKFLLETMETENTFVHVKVVYKVKEIFFFILPSHFTSSAVPGFVYVKFVQKYCGSLFMS